MSSYETSSLNEVEDILEGLEDPTAQQVFDATRPYSARAIAAVAAKTADSAGGGGGGDEFPDEWTVGAGGALGIEATTIPDDGVLYLKSTIGGGATKMIAVKDEADNLVFLVTLAGVATISTAAGGSATLGPVTQLVSEPDQEDPILDIYDDLGNALFRVDVDGTVHIKTGTTIQADL